MVHCVFIYTPFFRDLPYRSDSSTIFACAGSNYVECRQDVHFAWGLVNIVLHLEGQSPQNPPFSSQAGIKLKSL